MKLIKWFGCAILASSFALTSCSNVSNQDVGVVTGGAIGGALGSLFGSGSGKIAAAVGGTVLGAIIGGKIGSTMDKVDQMKMNQALESAHTGQTESWKNPDNGNRYSVTPTKTYYKKGRPCRSFVTTAYINGKQDRVYGKACRTSDGRWKMVN